MRVDPEQVVLPLGVHGGEAHHGSLGHDQRLHLCRQRHDPDETELAAFTISKLAAAEGASIFGEDADFIGNIVRDISDEVFEQLKMPRPGFVSPAQSERAA